MALQTRNGSTGYICLRVVFTRHLHCMLLVYQSIRMVDLLHASPFFSPSTQAGGGEVKYVSGSQEREGGWGGFRTS